MEYLVKRQRHHPDRHVVSNIKRDRMCTGYGDVDIVHWNKDPIFTKDTRYELEL